MEKIPYSHIQRGTFLVATPEIDTGLFFRAVILVCEHNSSGSFGLVVNKPLELELPEELVAIQSLVNPRVTVRAGGPIQTNQMMLLHDSEEIPHQTLKIGEGIYLGGDLEFLQGVITEEEGPSVMMCFGYTGWIQGQLEREFLDGHWLLYPAEARHLFEVSPEKLWQTVLREMGGRHASLSMMPEDLSVN